MSGLLRPLVRSRALGQETSFPGLSVATPKPGPRRGL